MGGSTTDALGHEWWAQRLPGYILALTLLIHNREAAYVYERAAAWGASSGGWWWNTQVFGYPYLLALHAHAGAAHAQAARLRAAYLDGSILQGAGEGAGEAKALEPLELSPPGTLVYLNLVRCGFFCLLHLVLADCAGMLLLVAGTWPFEAPSAGLLLVVRAAAWLLLEFAAFGHQVLFW